MNNLESYFKPFRDNIVGINASFDSPYGNKEIIYADWIASGRLYAPIEDKIKNEFGPFVANTHTETSETGMMMTRAYHKAHKIIKGHVNASSSDVIITAGFGMTAVINKLQRILSLKVCGKSNDCNFNKEEDKPIVFITHMEHHSNQTSWLETVADVEIIEPDKNLLVDVNDLKIKLEKYKNRKIKIGSFTACSNVTGISTPYHKMAKLMHEYGGVCFIDFAASAPYVDINMHPEDPMESLDAIFFSPHKFIGGPGSSGVLIFNSKLYKRSTPDHPGGGTVDWTNPWGKHKFIDNIEAREDGGTPGFLQAIRTALAINLKEKIGTDKIQERENQLVKIALDELNKIPEVRILANNIKERLACISFYIPGAHYNLIVKLLSDKFGVQVRGGCACAGTYGHYLLHVDEEHSNKITQKINTGDLSEKPGWIRMSLHPTTTDKELYATIDAIKEIIKNITELSKDYEYLPKVNEFNFKNATNNQNKIIDNWFKL